VVVDSLEFKSFNVRVHPIVDAVRDDTIIFHFQQFLEGERGLFIVEGETGDTGKTKDTFNGRGRQMIIDT
jgi:hypothetical protein